ncbi:MAG: hypothetical protein RIC19_02350 [Phaeodactylibacter sp.]|uniref:hypothetical protein n=1 Tax=Phaeodactylibacter sp. TaxID=1940289 RepID=UPI0032EDB2C1
MIPIFSRLALPLLLLTVCTLPVFGQEEAPDTTSAAYQIGYQIGSWLPFVIIFVLALLVIIRTYRLSQKNGPK